MKPIYIVSTVAMIAAFFTGGCSSVQDETRKQSGVCPSHHISMTRKRVPISYGLIVFTSPQPSYGVRAVEFPFARDYVLGGCVLQKNSPKRAIIHVCPACKLAEEKWIKAHVKDSG